MQKIGILITALVLLSGCAAGSFSDGNMSASYVRWGDQSLGGLSIESNGVNATLENQKSSGVDITKLLKVMEAIK